MTTWTDLSGAFGYGTKLTSSQMQQLRDNITAFTEKASGAPVLANDYVVAAMLDTGSVTADAIGAGEVGQSEIDSSAIGQGELKTTTSEVSVSISSIGITYYTAAIGGGEYALMGHIKKNSTGAVCNFVGFAYIALTTSYTNMTAGFTRDDGTVGTGYYRVRYVQASGELHWIFLLMKSGEIIATWEQPDHPCFGNSPYLEHPFFFPFNRLKKSECEIICLIPSSKDIEKIRKNCISLNSDGSENIYSGTKSVIDVFLDNYEIDESNEDDWPDVPVTIALPRIHKGKVVDDWRFMPKYELNEKTGLMEKVKVFPIQEVIKKPDDVTILKYKEKI